MLGLCEVALEIATSLYEARTAMDGDAELVDGC